MPNPPAIENALISLIIFLVGVVLPVPENPYPISKQNIRFSIPYFRPDSQNVHPISDPVICGKFGNSIDLWRTGLLDASKDVRVFFVRDQHPRKHTLAKNGIPDQIDGIYSTPYFRTRSMPYFRLEMFPNATPISIWLI